MSDDNNTATDFADEDAEFEKAFELENNASQSQEGKFEKFSSAIDCISAIKSVIIESDKADEIFNRKMEISSYSKNTIKFRIAVDDVDCLSTAGLGMKVISRYLPDDCGVSVSVEKGAKASVIFTFHNVG